VHTPAISTVHAVLDRHGLVKRRMARRNKAKGTPLSLPDQPNDLWSAAYKGEFMPADRRSCYPLTITGFASRYLFAREAVATTKEAYSFPAFEAVFKEYGLPNSIHTDNGVPFASPNAAQHELPVRAIPSIKAVPFPTQACPGKTYRSVIMSKALRGSSSKDISP
jgi:putative transposase